MTDEIEVYDIWGGLDSLTTAEDCIAGGIRIPAGTPISQIFPNGVEVLGDGTILTEPNLSGFGDDGPEVKDERPS